MVVVKLSGSLGTLPVILGELPKVYVSCFSNKGARTNRSITGRGVFVLIVTLVKDYGMGSVQFIYSSYLYIFKHFVQQELKVKDRNVAPFR